MTDTIKVPGLSGSFHFMVEINPGMTDRVSETLEVLSRIITADWSYWYSVYNKYKQIGIDLNRPISLAESTVYEFIRDVFEEILYDNKEVYAAYKMATEQGFFLLPCHYLRLPVIRLTQFQSVDALDILFDGGKQPAEFVAQSTVSLLAAMQRENLIESYVSFQVKKDLKENNLPDYWCSQGRVNDTIDLKEMLIDPYALYKAWARDIKSSIPPYKRFDSSIHIAETTSFPNWPSNDVIKVKFK